MGSLWVHLIVKMSLYRKGSAWNTFEIEELSVVELYTEHFRVLPEGSKKKKSTHVKLKNLCSKCSCEACSFLFFFVGLVCCFWFARGSWAGTCGNSGSWFLFSIVSLLPSTGGEKFSFYFLPIFFQ